MLKMKRSKPNLRGCLFIAAVLLLLSGCYQPLAVSVQAPSRWNSDSTVMFEENEQALTFSNEDLSVVTSKENGEFTVTVKKTGQVFYSNPVDKDADEAGRGIQKLKMYSQLYASFLDNATGTTVFKISQTGSVTKDGFAFERLKNGVRLLYTFPDNEITIPLDVTIQGERLSALVDVSHIKEGKDYRLESLSILPYFGSGSATEKGFLFIPDGSGAMVDFQVNKSNSQPYNQTVYGGELTYRGDMKPTKTTPIRMPVYGIQRNGDAFFAEISKGAGAASIEAFGEGMINHHNTVYPTFQILGSSTVSIGNSTQGAVKQSLMFETDRPMTDLAQVDYYFLPKESGIMGMALKYRELLKSRGVGRDAVKNNRLMCEFVAGVTKKESFIGFLVDKHRALSSLKDVNRALDTMNTAAEDLSVIYSGWSKNEIDGQFPTKAKLDSVLGSNTELRNTAARLGEQNFWLSYEPLLLKKSGNGFSSYFDTVKRIGGEIAKLYSYQLSTSYMDDRYIPQYIIKTPLLKDGFKRYFSSMKKLNAKAGLYSRTLGSTIYTDFSKEETMRDEAKANVQQTLGAASQKWALYQPNDYALPYTDTVVSAPIASSDFDLFTEDVPFYQLALNGLVNLTVDCVNEQDQPQHALLNALETGSSLYFRLFLSDPALVKDTGYSNLCYGYFDYWADTVTTLYRRYTEATRQIGSSVVVEHTKISDRVYASTYDNGTKVLVNYSNQAVTVEGHPIPSGEFLVVGGKEEK